MNGIEELRQRVLDAEERFGRFNEQHVTAGGRLIDLMNAVEARIRDQQGEIERQKSAIDRHRTEIETQKAKIDGHGTAIAQQAEEIEKFKASAAHEAEENEQLRTMLHSLLQASEAGSRDVLAEAMMQLDSKVSVLMGDGAPEAVAEPEGPATEEPAEIAAEVQEPVAEEPVAEEPVEPVSEIEEPITQEPDEITTEEPAVEDVVEPVAETAAPGSLDEIMGRVSKLVQETEAAIAAPEPAAAESEAAAPAEAPEEPAEEPAQQASAAAS